MLVPGLSEQVDPTEHPKLWEVASELALIVGLFGTGLRIDRLVSWSGWSPTIRLLAVAMPLSIASVAILGSALAGMTLAGALLLGAVLAPTDPVLAGDVQVGPPLEGGEHPVRFTLTTEAGLNDGLAFPFVHLALAIAAAGAVGGELLLQWVWLDVLYRIAVGLVSGAALGWLLGKLLFEFPGKNPLAKTEAGLVALAGVLLCYGATELIEGYGFIASFVAGMTLRRSETKHAFHRRLHDFTQTIEHALTGLLLVALGLALPVLWLTANWTHVAVGALLIFLLRPVSAWTALSGVGFSRRQRLVVSFYGVRGIGSIYYIAYASTHLELVNEQVLWVTVAITILISTLVHGLTAGLAVERVTGEYRREMQR
jgi:NhaP-type Na+/H+ or K+/H+ antiporter